MRKRTSLTVLAVVLALFGLGFSAFFLSRLPRTLTIAVGPAGLETHRYVTALANSALEGRERIRFKVVTTAGAQESAQLLERSGVDLALIRSDYDLPPNGQTLIVNTRRTVVIAVPNKRTGGIQKLSDLKGKRIAVARFTDPNIPLIRKLLSVVDISESEITLIDAEPEAATEILKANRADAIVIVAPRISPVMTKTIADINKAIPGGIRLLAIEEAQAAADRILGLETIEIPVAAFGNGLPKEELKSVAVSYRIMAQRTMSDDLAGRTAKTLYDQRTRLSRQVPIAFSAEPPDGKTGARIPVHPGAMAYFDGETKTFYERYGELIFTGLWGASILGSGLAGFIAWLGRKRHGEGSKLVDEITALTASARTASAADLIGIEARGDAIVAHLARLRQNNHVSDAMVESASLALDHFRSVVEGMRG